MVSTSAIKTELQERLPELSDDEELLSKCLSLCSDYRLSAEEMYYKWEALRFGKHKITDSALKEEIKLEDVEQLRKDAQNEITKKSAISQRASNKQRQTQQALLGGRSTNMQKVNLNAIFSSSSRPQVKATAPAAPLASLSPRVVFKGQSADELSKRKFRYMYETSGERSSVLDEQIEAMLEEIKRLYRIGEIGDPNSMTENDIYVVGRICGEADESAVSSPSSKLADGTMYLESSRFLGSGRHRIPLAFTTPLKLRGVPQGSGSFGVFPGAVVALKGKNGSGNCFVVNEILTLPPLMVESQSEHHKAFSMAIACGPYTSDSNFEYSAFEAFIQSASSRQPSVLLLLGPFVDAFHSRVKSADMSQTPLEIFKERIISSLHTFLSSSPDTLILIVPSIRDMLSDHPVLPQSMFDNFSLSDHRIKFLPNPCRFSVNGVSLAVTSVDVLFQLKSQEVIQRGEEVDPRPTEVSDPISNSCRHILQQRSFYPLFPVPIEYASEVNLDVSHSDGLALQTDSHPHAPDVLVIPSKLKQFSKVIDSTLAINPSFATKGTYAFLTVSDTSRNTLHENMQCEIVKL